MKLITAIYRGAEYTLVDQVVDAIARIRADR